MSQHLLQPASRLVRGGLPTRFRQLHIPIRLNRNSRSPVPSPRRIQTETADPEGQKSQNGQHKQGKHQYKTGEENSKKKKPFPWKTAATGVLIVALITDSLGPEPLYSSWTQSLTAPPLSEVRFKPFKVVAREQVSSTAFIITVAPKRLPSDLSHQRDVMRELLRRGVWAVEVKQPQLQVARDYTPLPPLSSEEEEAMIEKCQLRFLVRRMERGEVSKYISRLQVGDEIELRGHRLGFDVIKRLGDKGNKVAFLAGGTGIASALQVARTLLATPGDKQSQVSIIWANRKGEDCADSTPINRMLEQMRKTYGDVKFKYVCTIDEERSFIDSKLITQTAGIESSSKTAAIVPTPVTAWENCTYHSSTKLITSPAEDPETKDITHISDRHAMKDRQKFDPKAAPQCQCPGKNLLMISGPDGFVEYFAGKKVWGQGKELQGPVGGVIDELQRRYPELGEKWLVLKM